MKVKIGWKEYEVSKKAEIYVRGNTCYGEIDYEDAEIHLLASNSISQEKVTLVHEVLHGISDMYGMDLKEPMVEKLSNAVYTLIVDNPDLLDYFEAEEAK